MATGQVLILGKAVHARRDGTWERRELRLAGLLMALMAVGALYGGIGLVLAPDGSLLQLPSHFLQQTPFASYAIPGFLLALTVGGSAVAGAVLAFVGHRGLLQAIVLAWGLVLLALGLWVARTRLS